MMNDTNPRHTSLDELRDQQSDPIDLPAFSQDEPDADLIFDMTDVFWAAVGFVCTLLFVWWLA